MKPILKLLILFPLSMLLVFACHDGGAETTRGALGKADLIGSCSNACDGQSTAGTCWCDSACTDHGDCCSDVVAECGLDLCGSCLASGGTWQPEAQACTDNCDIQDISCFTDACPVEPADCGACLASGGTWQPEAQACTDNCDIQDISCFTDACPVEPADCDACLASGGTWQPEAQACTDNCDIQDISCFTDSCPQSAP